MADGDVINQRQDVPKKTLTAFDGSTLFFSTWISTLPGAPVTILNTFWFNSVPATVTYYSWDSVASVTSDISRDGVPTTTLTTFLTTPVSDIPVLNGTTFYTPVIIGAKATNAGPTPLSSATSSSSSTSSSQPTPTASAPSTTTQVFTPSSTAAASTSTPSHTSTSNSSSSGISAGAAAGIGIGCAIAGALIAFAFLFFCLRKRGRRGTSAADGAGGYVAPTARSPDEKIPLTGVGAFGGAGIGALVENNLPQPVEDQAIVESLSKLRSSIKNHVQSFYHSSPTNVGDVNQEALEALGDELPMPSSMLRLQLSDPGSRNAALRFCIAFAIISRLGFRSSPSDTLLPPEVAGCFQSMRGMETNVKVRDAFLSRWRAITSTLMQPTYGRNAFPVGDARSSNVNKLLGLLDSILYSFASNSQDSFQRRKNLEEILKRAAGVAFLLFSQPSAWQFEWEEARANEPGSLVVFPALLQTVDETGRLLNPPQAFTQVEVSR